MSSGVKGRFGDPIEHDIYNLMCALEYDEPVFKRKERVLDVVCNLVDQLNENKTVSAYEKLVDVFKVRYLDGKALPLDPDEVAQAIADYVADDIVKALSSGN